MDITTFFHSINAVSIVAWFALLVVVFAGFVSVGIYQSRRSQQTQVGEVDRRSSVPSRSKRSSAHRKEYS